jgi:murein L,D-transpeptidase YcbB/YkuD
MVSAAQLLREMFAGAVLCCLLGPQSAAEQISQTSGTQVHEQSPAFVARDELAAPVTGLGQEFEALLVTVKRMVAAERTDREALKTFYAARGNEPLWVTSTGYTAAAVAARAELARADEWGLDQSAFRTSDLSQARELTPTQRAEADVALSLAVLRYARHARGGRIDPLSLSRNMDRQPPTLEPEKVLADVTVTDDLGAYLRSLHPQHPQFERLRQLYRATTISEEDIAGPKAKAGKKRKPSPNLLTREKLLFNMEQWRWMPADLGQFYVWVNIPEFMVRVVKDTREIYSARVVVGRPSTPTPVFSDRMEYLIFHPFWNVPDSIKSNELQPSLASGDYSVLNKQNLRVSFRGRDIEPGAVDWGRVDMRKYHIYQPPGAGNALGLVKFLFPNTHDVYLHDTPSKRLFHSQVRAFSHGCIRVQNPLKLAEVLLAEDQGWTAERVARTVEQGARDNKVDLHSKFPVHLTYFTVWVEDDGRVRSFSDIYDHEHRVAYALAGKSHLIRREPDPPIAQAKPPQRPAAASRKADDWEGSHRTSSSGRSGRNTEWMRKVFQD